MAILQITTNVTGLVDVHPRLIYINTDDTIAQVITTGYLNQVEKNGTILYTTDVAMVSTIASVGADPIAEFYQVTNSGSNWSLELLPGSGGVHPGTQNDLAYYATTGAYISPLTTANSAMLRTNASGVPAWSASMTNGQLMIGSTGSSPTPSTITAGSGINILNSAGTITISSTSGGLSTATIAGTTQLAAINTQYIALNASQTTVTLPAAFVVGDVIAVIGSAANTGGWIIQAGAGDTIRVNNASTSSGGTITSSGFAGECIELICDVADTSWVMTSTVSVLLTTA